MELLQKLQQDEVISAATFDTVVAAIDNGARLEQVLLEQSVPEATVRDALAASYGVDAFTPTENMSIDNDVLKLIPEESAKHYRLVPIDLEDGVLRVGVNDPESIQIREVLNFVSTRHHIPYKLVFLLESDISSLLSAYDSLTGEVDEALTSLEDELDSEIADRTREAGEGGGSGPELDHIKEDAPVTKIVATVLRYAVDGGASDIHIEPFQNQVRVRFRVDGHLQTSLQLPKNVQSAVVARVKILSSMRLDERRKPQDGRFSATFDGRKIDFRVSVLPTNGGEKVVMRILDSEKGVHTLDGTGITAHNINIMKRAAHVPYGIVLISGPTGSGKSTTLYSMLGEVDKEGKNVLSLEDPVEYNIDGVAQSQVRPEIGYTFAAGLRSALRQDPDIILVGEIRDKETAQLAIQAALTGHLVFSTIHTNNSIGVIPRLIDMGVDPYLIAPTLKLAVAQRLARRICPGSGLETNMDGAVNEMVQEVFETLPAKHQSRVPASRTVLQLEPSEACPSGTKGRVAVTECLEVTDEIQGLILQNASEEEIYDVARKNGFMTMREDALIKSLEHTIPFEEVGVFGSQSEEVEMLEEVPTISQEPVVLSAGDSFDVPVDNNPAPGLPNV